jgi:hypothetical protein
VDSRIERDPTARALSPSVRPQRMFRNRLIVRWTWHPNVDDRRGKGRQRRNGAYVWEGDMMGA